MNRIDRLFAILLTLQHKRRARAQDLARQFEISKRTIYRDMSALNQMGIPIAAMPGEGFELVEGYYLPPLMFNENEAVALTLGLRLLTQQAAGSVTQAAESASAKIKVALPDQVRVRSDALSGMIEFLLPPEKFNLDDPLLLTLQKAIRQKQIVHIRYHSYSRDDVSERDIEPYRLFYSTGVWYVEGYCRLRRDVRMFRLSRLEALSLKKGTFTKIHAASQPAWHTVQVRFTKQSARWVRERQHYAFLEERDTEDGVIMTFRVNDLSEIGAWVLSWGASAETLSPPELRESLRKSAQELADLLT